MTGMLGGAVINIDSAGCLHRSASGDPMVVHARVRPRSVNLSTLDSKCNIWH